MRQAGVFPACLSSCRACEGRAAAKASAAVFLCVLAAKAREYGAQNVVRVLPCVGSALDLFPSTAPPHVIIVTLLCKISGEGCGMGEGDRAGGDAVKRDSVRGLDLS